MADERTIASIALREYAGVDPRLIAELALRIGPPEAIVESPDLEGLPDTLLSPELLIEIRNAPMRYPEIESRLNLLSDRDIDVHSVYSSSYPEGLRSLADPPPYLYVRGLLPAQPVCICVTGRTNPSADAIADAVTVGRQLGAAGMGVVSGLTPGIETAVHVGLLGEDRPSFAFCGFGLEAELPPDVSAVAEQIAVQGGLCSEYPESIDPTHDLRAESVRLHLGVCAGVIVVHGEEDPASTAVYLEAAQLEGKPVFFLGPGESVASERLLSAGAYPLTDAANLDFVVNFV
jgi:DNA processing protein